MKRARFYQKDVEMIASIWSGNRKRKFHIKRRKLHEYNFAARLMYSNNARRKIDKTVVGHSISGP